MRDTDGMAEEVGGVRDHLANERTQLAWLRTGASVMVVGLAAARYGGDGEVTVASLAAGSVLVLAGLLLIAFGTQRYQRVAAELHQGTAATASATRGPTIAAMGLLLALLVAGLLLFLP